MGRVMSHVQNHSWQAHDGQCTEAMGLLLTGDIGEVQLYGMSSHSTKGVHLILKQTLTECVLTDNLSQMDLLIKSDPIPLPEHHSMQTGYV